MGRPAQRRTPPRWLAVLPLIALAAWALWQASPKTSNAPSRPPATSTPTGSTKSPSTPSVSSPGSSVPAQEQAAQLRAMSFNIENYPSGPEQAAGAFALIRDAKVSLLAVQEIIDPAQFARDLHARVGASWNSEFVELRGDPAMHRVGIAFDGAIWTLDWAKTRRETAIRGQGGKPALEARLVHRATGGALRVISVHFKAGSDGLALRELQYQGLTTILNANTADARVVLGDFNATSPRDRELLAALAADAGLHWASEGLACTSFWDRRKDCVGSALDHALLSKPPRSVVATGACADAGCGETRSCPLATRTISDHCPLVVEW